MPLAVALALLEWLVLYLGLSVPSTALWVDKVLPYQPLRVGPSVLTLEDLAVFLGVTVWLPVATLYGFHRLCRRPIMPRRAAVGLFLWYSILVTGRTFGFLSITETNHEDTLLPGGSLGPSGGASEPA